MLVQGPTKGNDNDVDAIFNRARQMGAQEASFEQLNPSSSSRSFIGTGRSLSGESVPTAPQQPKSVIHNIVFWTNGFNVNDGPLRSLEDHENASFLESIKKSECPKELEPADGKSTVHVNLIRELFEAEVLPELMPSHNHLLTLRKRVRHFMEFDGRTFILM